MQHMQCYCPPTGAWPRVKQRAIPDLSIWKVYPVIIVSQTGKILLTI